MLSCRGDSTPRRIPSPQPGFPLGPRFSFHGFFSAVAAREISSRGDLQNRGSAEVGRQQLKGPSYLVGDFLYVGKVDGLVLLVVSVGLLVSGVQAQPTTIIPANEGSSARWRIQLGRAISIFCVRFGRYRK